MRHAGLPLTATDALHTAWWWSRVALMEERIRGIYEASALDPERLVAPRELWPTSRDEELKAFYADRERLRKQRDQERPLNDY